MQTPINIVTDLGKQTLVREQHGLARLASTNVIQSIGAHLPDIVFNKLWLYPASGISDAGLLVANSATIYVGKRGDGPDVTPDTLAPADLPMRIELPAGLCMHIGDIICQGAAGDGLLFTYW